MPYLVLAGTKVTITRPDGKPIQYVCQRHNVFAEKQASIDNRLYHFQQDGFRLTAHVADVKRFAFTCLQCAAVLSSSGVCANCTPPSQ